MNGFDFRIFRGEAAGSESPSTSNNYSAYGKHRTIDNVSGSHLSRTTSRSGGSTLRQGEAHKAPSRSISTSGRPMFIRDETPGIAPNRRSGSALRRNEASEGSSGKSTRPRSASTLRREVASDSSGRGTGQCRSTFILKAPPVERNLECTLEELFHGCVKKILVTRTIIGIDGKMVQEQEKLKIKVKPGWKTGTKITFEGLGDDRPGTLPSDLVFVIAEKRHPLFKRDGNDLILMRELPLVKALTGCTLCIPLIGGEKMNIALKEIIRPGFEMIIKGQGMPDAKHQGKRGDLRVEFQVKFPSRLSKEQQIEIKELLQGMSLA